MRRDITLTLSHSDRLRLEALTADRNTPPKHVWRARIVLFSADDVGSHGVVREAGVLKTSVWRWQERFMQQGIEGL